MKWKAGPTNTDPENDKTIRKLFGFKSFIMKPFVYSEVNVCISHTYFILLYGILKLTCTISVGLL